MRNMLKKTHIKSTKPVQLSVKFQNIRSLYSATSEVALAHLLMHRKKRGGARD